MSQEDPHGAPSSGMSNFSIRLTAHSSFRDITLIRFDRAGPLETLSEAGQGATEEYKMLHRYT